MKDLIEIRWHGRKDSLNMVQSEWVRRLLHTIV